jgi:UDP:flavonoid glycosyltransferase YjiC (YdhE family)
MRKAVAFAQTAGLYTAMKYLLVTLGSIGDLMPFLAVADALRQRGHAPVIASHAGYAQLVQGSGFEFAVVSERPQHALDGILETDPDKAWQMVRQEVFIPATQPVRDFIAHHARLGPCRVIASWNAFGAPLAQKEFGVPGCRVCLSPLALAEDSNGQTGQQVGFFPSWFAPEVLNVPLTGFVMVDEALVPALPATLEGFLRDGPSPVIFTPGSFMRRAATFFRESLAVCQRLGLRAIFLTPYSDQVPEALPPNIQHFKFISLQRLAPYGAALVHHGGIGTCAQALRAGIPQLISPVFFDQHDNAARVEALGVGQRTFTYLHAEVGDKLGQLLASQSVRDNCATIRARFSGSDALGQTCSFAEAMG